MIDVVGGSENQTPAHGLESQTQHTPTSLQFAFDDCAGERMEDIMTPSWGPSRPYGGSVGIAPHSSQALGSGSGLGAKEYTMTMIIMICRLTIFAGDALHFY